MDRDANTRSANRCYSQRDVQRWQQQKVLQNQTKEKDQVQLNELIQRKQDIKSRLDSLRNELAPLVTRVESLRERIVNLEDDYRDVLDKIRDEEKKVSTVK